MEAANLGAYLSPWPGSLDDALMIMTPAPTDRPSIDGWARTAFEVRARWPVASQAAASASRPGSTATNPPTSSPPRSPSIFPTHCERTRCSITAAGGVVYLPGQAGTVQEIFQAVTENFYAADASLVAPLILVGREYWTDVYPAWPLLQRLGAGRAMGELIYCVDDVQRGGADLLTAGDLTPGCAVTAAATPRRGWRG